MRVKRAQLQRCRFSMPLAELPDKRFLYYERGGAPLTPSTPVALFIDGTGSGAPAACLRCAACSRCQRPRPRRGDQRNNERHQAQTDSVLG